MNDNQKTMFVNYCKTHPIDLYILNKINTNVLFELYGDMIIFYYNGNPYVNYTSKLHSYLFKLKDGLALNELKSFELGNKSSDCSDKPFVYDEPEYIVNGNRFGTVVFNVFEQSVYIFDKETKIKLVYISSTNVFFSRDAYKKFYNKIPHSYLWTNVKKYPDELKDIIETNKILLTLKDAI